MVVVNGTLMEPGTLRPLVALPSDPQPQQADWVPTPFPRPQRAREPTGPLAPIEKLEPVEQSIGDAVGTAVLYVLALAAFALVWHWTHGGT
jgi:hypothetical protein